MHRVLGITLVMPYCRSIGATDDLGMTPPNTGSNDLNSRMWHRSTKAYFWNSQAASMRSLRVPTRSLVTTNRIRWQERRCLVDCGCHDETPIAKRSILDADLYASRVITPSRGFFKASALP
ncbi:hypothetical protein WG66_016725 [Moniliophthora roreri]|nr:hypothetical protein WG66_016725 [Moniliophthora roreri]